MILVIYHDDRLWGIFYVGIARSLGFNWLPNGFCSANSTCHVLGGCGGHSPSGAFSIFSEHAQKNMVQLDWALAARV